MKYYLEDWETAVPFKYSPEVHIKHFNCHDNTRKVDVRKSTLAIYKRIFKKYSELNNVLFLAPKLYGQYGRVEEISTEGLNYCEIEYFYEHAVENKDETFLIVRLEGTYEHNLMLHFLPIDIKNTPLQNLGRREMISTILKTL